MAGAPLVRVRARALSMSSLTQTPHSHTSIQERLHPYQTDAGASRAQMHTQEARRKQMGVCRVCDVCLTMVPGPSAILLQRLAPAVQLSTFYDQLTSRQ